MKLSLVLGLSVACALLGQRAVEASPIGSGENESKGCGNIGSSQNKDDSADRIGALIRGCSGKDVEEVKEDSDVEEVKEDSDVGEVKEDSDVEEVKEDSDAEEVKEDSDVGEVKEDSDFEELKEDSDVEWYDSSKMGSSEMDKSSSEEVEGEENGEEQMERNRRSQGTGIKESDDSRIMQELLEKGEEPTIPFDTGDMSEPTTTVFGPQ